MEFLDIHIPHDVRAKWRAKPTPELIYRLEVLGASGPYPEDEYRADLLRYRRATRAAWEAYFTAATACGLFDSERGRELRARLASDDPNDFRSAMAEVMTCWFFAGKHRLNVSAVARGRSAKTLDLGVDLGSGRAGVEIKAPYRERPTEPWSGDESDKIAQAMDSANKQFSDSCANVLVIVPQLRVPIFSSRDDLLRAAFGHSQYVVPINIETGDTGQGRIEFRPAGKFLNTRRKGGKPLKPDGLPGFRRIGAILCIEEALVERKWFHFSSATGFVDKMAMIEREARKGTIYSECWMEHNVLVIHNPHALHPLSHEVWREYPQFVPMPDGTMQWTDGHRVAV